MTLRLKQALVIVLGVVVAAVMIALGLWQMARFQLSVEDVAQQRAQQPPVELAPAVHPDGSIDDIFGRRVEVSGVFLPEFSTTLTDEKQRRDLSLLRLPDGRHLAVVRGAVSPGQPIPPPPAGQQRLSGIFSASESEDTPGEPLRLQSLAQRWPTPLIAGFVTADAQYAKTQGLSPATVRLPKQHGTYMHQGYALQWWVFAAAAVAFAIFTARQLRINDEAKRKRRDRRRQLQAGESDVKPLDVDSAQRQQSPANN